MRTLYTPKSKTFDGESIVVDISEIERISHLLKDGSSQPMQTKKDGGAA